MNNIGLKVSILIMLFLFVSTSSVLAGALNACVDLAKSVGAELTIRKAKAAALSNGLIRYSWKNNTVFCETFAQQVINLKINNIDVFVDGFASTEAYNLFQYMQGQNNKMLSDCRARHSGTIEVFDQTYLPKLRKLAPNLTAIKEQFDHNFSRVSRDYYITQFYNNQKSLLRLVAFDDILSNLPKTTQIDKNCIALADKVVARETNLHTRIENLLDKISHLKGDLAFEKGRVNNLTMELARSEQYGRDVLKELKKFEKLRKLKIIEKFLKNQNFPDATASLNDLLSRFKLEKSESKRLEVIAIEIVKPLPAANTSANREGYEFLNKLLPSNNYYKTKLKNYFQN